MIAPNSSFARLDHATKKRKLPIGLSPTVTYQAPTSHAVTFIALKTRSRWSL